MEKLRHKEAVSSPRSEGQKVHPRVCPLVASSGEIQEGPWTWTGKNKWHLDLTLKFRVSFPSRMRATRHNSISRTRVIVTKRNRQRFHHSSGASMISSNWWLITNQTHRQLCVIASGPCYHVTGSWVLNKEITVFQCNWPPCNLVGFSLCI